ncbi:MAG TPA: aspartyl protease family protein [Longimicrobium sp.]|nr:aspartyl protease family protein [Longimicrobium sp.]
MDLPLKVLPLLSLSLLMPAAAIRMHAQAPVQASTARAGALVAEIPFVLRGDHVMLRAGVNGHEGWLALDTGSSMSSLDADWADTAAHVRVVSTGAQVQGSQSVRSSIGQADSVRVGNVELGATNMVLIPLGAVHRARGAYMHGTIGYDFLARYVVEIDYAAQRLRLYDPARWSYSGRGVEVPVNTQYRIPVVQATLTPAGGPPVTARMVLDLGSANFAVRLVAPFAAAHNLAALPGIDAPIGTGVGGTMVGRVARLESASLGALRVNAPTAGIALRPEGFFGSTMVDGTIGAPVFRRTRMFIDYPHSRVIFETGPGFDAPFENDMSGMSVMGAPGEPVTVTYVVAGSPAAQAGIETGDVLVAVDGAPARPEEFDALRATFRSAPGATRRLTLRRGAETREVTITLRRLV